MMRSSLSEYFLHLLIFAIAVLALYGGTYLNWGSNLMGAGEDTMKNFFTFAYYILHGKEWFWFTGMNHPFGEHLTFTDNQPLIAFFFKAVNAVIPLEGSITWIIPTLLLFSFQIGSFFIFKSLKKLDVTAAFAFPLSVGVMLLSPQWARLAGHYSLAHGFLLPLLIFLLLSERRSRNALMIGVLLFLSGFIHPYFIAMGSLFTCLFLGLELITSSAIRRPRAWLVRTAVSFLPLIFFQLTMFLTDHVIDRPEVPFGYLFFRATFPSIILPLYADYAIFIMRMFPGWVAYSNEGAFYIGAAAILGTVFGLIGRLIQIFKQRSISWAQSRSKWVLILAAIPVFFLAIGAPFIYEGYEHFLEHGGPLRQFRGIGRFAFVFYYAINIFAIALVGQVLKKRSHRAIAWGVFVVILAVEIVPYRNHIIQRTVSSVKTTAALPEINASTYDAVLTIPYFHIGSENFGTRETEHIAHAAMKVSLETGLPLVGVQMSRTSLKQTVALLLLTGEQMALHPFSESLKEESWLIMVDRLSEITSPQKQLLMHGTPIGTFEQFDLYRFSPSAFKTLYRNQLEAIEEKQTSAALLTALPDSLDVRFRSFDDQHTSLSYKGKGALSFERKNWTPLIEKGTTLQRAEPYELTFWVRYSDQHAVNTQLWYWERNGEEDVEFEVSEVAHHVVGFDGDWALCKVLIEPHSEKNTFELLLHRDEAMKVWVDEVLLRPLGVDVRRSGNLNLNNRFYKPIDETAVDLSNFEP